MATDTRLNKIKHINIWMPPVWKKQIARKGARALSEMASEKDGNDGLLHVQDFLEDSVSQFGTRWLIVTDFPASDLPACKLWTCWQTLRDRPGRTGGLCQYCLAESASKSRSYKLVQSQLTMDCII